MPDDTPNVKWGHSQELSERITKAFGLSRSPLHVLDDDDWSFVIKMHAYIEAAINQLLTAHFNDSKLDEIIHKMDMGHDKRGKLGLVKVLGLLPQGAWSFVKLLGDLRSTVVHNIKELDLDLVKHLRAPERKKQWQNAMNWWRSEHSAEDDELVLMYPRHAIFDAAILVMSQTAVQKTEVAARHSLEKVMSLEGQYAMTRRKVRKRTKSSPRKSSKRHRPKVRKA